MTDNEIIKALECCSKNILCGQCPLKEKNNCINKLIERLQKENKQNFDKWLILEKRTEEKYAELYKTAKEVVKVEAVREFAERLKETKFKHYNDYIVYSENIDVLVKEMVGDTE